LRFVNIDYNSIKGLVYDFNEFIDINKISLEPTMERLRDFFHYNFIFFLTENHNCIFGRNIEDVTDFPHIKIKLKNHSVFPDYYKLPGGDFNSNLVVLAEGPMDILSEQLYDYINIKKTVNFYTSALSSNYNMLIRSIIHNEQIFKPDVIILGDSDVDVKRYKKFKYHNRFILNSLTVYNNRNGKDFNILPVEPVKISV